jgi:CHASE1-domain containing sensor protein
MMMPSHPTDDDHADADPAPDGDGRPAAGALRPRVLPWVVLACTLLSTFAVAYYVWSKDKLRTDSAAREAAQLARDRIQSRMDRYVALLRGAAGLVANRLQDGAARMPEYRKEFAAYVERLELAEHYPGIQGLGFALRINPDERGGFESAMRRAHRG